MEKPLKLKFLFQEKKSLGDNLRSLLCRKIVFVSHLHGASVSKTCTVRKPKKQKPQKNPKTLQGKKGGKSRF